MSDSDRERRLQKIQELRERGVNPYPDRFPQTHTIAEARTLGESLDLTPGEDPTEGAERLRIAGRIVLLRSFGKLAFVTIQNVDGKIQIALNQRVLTKPVLKQFVKDTDVGDFVGCEGPLFRTKKGELTIMVESVQLLGKTLRGLPEKWAGLKNQETRWRQRYLDLIANEGARDRFKQRTRTISVMRRFLDDHKFFEVETPVLVTKPSGALARPFIAHHNSLDLDVYLRIAPETYLKQLVVGGFDRVYEFARCFRNEGMDPSHLQDFTMLEWYAAYWNYQDNMDFTERLIAHTLQEVTGGLQVAFGGKETDFAGPWPRRRIRDMILEDSGIDIHAMADADALRAEMKAKGVRLELAAEELNSMARGNLIDQLYKKVSRPKVTNPIFVTHHPSDLSPLARRNDDNPAIVDRFQLVVHGWEIVNAYSELVDPIDQRQRLEEQATARDAGDAEAMMIDEDYLTSMEHGMPPISGFGLGIDRFCALLSGQENLRDVIFFPLLRPLGLGKGDGSDAAAEASDTPSSAVAATDG